MAADLMQKQPMFTSFTGMSSVPGRTYWQNMSWCRLQMLKPKRPHTPQCMYFKHKPVKDATDGR